MCKLGVEEWLVSVVMSMYTGQKHLYGYVLWKEDNDWVKKCIEYEVEGPRARGRPKKTWREIVKKDCQARKLNRENAKNHNR